MVHTGLVFSWRVNGVTLAKLDLIPLFQCVKLPANKGVIVRVDTRGDKRSPPINLERL